MTTQTRIDKPWIIFNSFESWRNYVVIWVKTLLNKFLLVIISSEKIGVHKFAAQGSDMR